MCALLSQRNRLNGWYVAFRSFLLPTVKVAFILFQVYSVASIFSSTLFDFNNTLQDMPLALLKEGCQWSSLIDQKLLKLKSMFLMCLLPLFDQLWQSMTFCSIFLSIFSDKIFLLLIYLITIFELLFRYAFKCHRKSEDGRDIVYPVNAIAFHPM